jgi:Ni/Co efflux regulator RcnB
MKIMISAALACAIGLAFAVADIAHAKDNKNNPGKGNSPKVQQQNKVQNEIRNQARPGKGPKAIPPGQIKRYTRGAKLPPDLRYEPIRELSRWRLGPPGPGYRYIRVGDQVLKVTDDMSTVVDAVGIVGDLLR